MISVNYEIRRQLGLLLSEEIRQRHLSAEDVVKSSGVYLIALKRMAQGKLVGWRQYHRVCKFLNQDVEVHLVKNSER